MCRVKSLDVLHDVAQPTIVHGYRTPLCVSMCRVKLYAVLYDVSQPTIGHGYRTPLCVSMCCVKLPSVLHDVSQPLIGHKYRFDRHSTFAIHHADGIAFDTAVYIVNPEKCFLC
jgi:hypothetical protein